MTQRPPLVASENRVRKFVKNFHLGEVENAPMNSFMKANIGMTKPWCSFWLRRVTTWVGSRNCAIKIERRTSPSSASARQSFNTPRNNASGAGRLEIRKIPKIYLAHQHLLGLDVDAFVERASIDQIQQQVAILKQRRVHGRRRDVGGNGIAIRLSAGTIDSRRRASNSSWSRVVCRNLSVANSNLLLLQDLRMMMQHLRWCL